MYSRIINHPKFYLFDTGVYRAVRPKGPLDRPEEIEVKRAASLRARDLNGLKAFAKDYPESNLYMFYGGKKRKFIDDINLIPTEEALPDLPALLKQK